MTLNLADETLHVADDAAREAVAAAHTAEDAAIEAEAAADTAAGEAAETAERVAVEVALLDEASGRISLYKKSIFVGLVTCKSGFQVCQLVLTLSMLLLEVGVQQASSW